MPLGLKEMVEEALANVEAISARAVREGLESENRDSPVIVYCLKAPGARSLLAAQTLQRMGYSNVAAMRGGFEEWRAEGLPAE
jgi:rhodanese-related sulfurtransferase